MGIHPSRKKLKSLAYVFFLIWAFFSIGPGLIFGNSIFGNADQSYDKWVMGVPSLWAYQIIWWVVGVFLIWFLANKMDLSTLPKNHFKWWWTLVSRWCWGKRKLYWQNGRRVRLAFNSYRNGCSNCNPLSLCIMIKNTKKMSILLIFSYSVSKYEIEKMLEWWTTNKINKCLIIAINTLPMFN